MLGRRGERWRVRGPLFIGRRQHDPPYAPGGAHACRVVPLTSGRASSPNSEVWRRPRSRTFPFLERNHAHSKKTPPLPEGSPAHLLNRGPVFQMLVLPTQPRGGSVMFSFSSSSCTACATTPTASLMCADSFLPLMSCSPMMPAGGSPQRVRPRAAPPPAQHSPSGA